MANPTTNYGWPMPTSSDLVTDLPADFAAFGQPVDTSLKALNPETTLGDISYRSSTANTNTRLGIGSTGQVLTVAAGVPSWATPATPTTGLTFISRTAFSASSSTSVNSVFSSTYDNYKILFYADTFTGDNAEVLMRLRISSDTTTNYSAQRLIAANTTVSADVDNNGTDDWLIALGDKDFPSVWAVIELNNPNVVDPTNYVSQASGATTTHFMNMMGGWQSATTQFTGFTLFTSTGNMTGFIDVYGYQKA